MVTVDYEFYDQQDVDSARELVAALRRGEKPLPTRGAPLTDFQGISRQLAGFSQYADAAARGRRDRRTRRARARRSSGCGWPRSAASPRPTMPRRSATVVLRRAARPRRPASSPRSAAHPSRPARSLADQNDGTDTPAGQPGRRARLRPSRVPGKA